MKTAHEVEKDWNAATLRQERRQEAERFEAAAKRCREVGANYCASQLEAAAKRLRAEAHG